MKSEEIYNDWKENKIRMEIREGFTDEIMNKVYGYEHRKNTSLFDLGRFVELISEHALAKTAFIVGGAITGIVRLIFMILMILNKGVING